MAHALVDGFVYILDDRDYLWVGPQVMGVARGLVGQHLSGNGTARTFYFQDHWTRCAGNAFCYSLLAGNLIRQTFTG